MEDGVIRMGNRKTIPKKIRFEVFKRDGFTCQYCGRMAPDVILEVDHIQPVAEGGDNDMINLVTSCMECNRGKGKTLLSDDEELKRQQRQLRELHEKTQQAEMMVEWKKELMKVREREVELIDELIVSLTEYHLSENGKADVRKYIKRFSFSEVYEACEIAFEKYYDSTGAEYRQRKTFDYALNKVGGICYNKRRSREDGNI